MIYTSVEKVVSVLSTSSGKKRVRTSSTGLKNVKSEQTLPGELAKPVNARRREPSGLTIVSRSLISIGPDYVGDEMYIFEFTSPTAFNVWHFDDSSYLLLGSGTIGVDFDIPDTDITIQAGCFSGTISNLSMVTLTFSAHVSDNQLIEYINQTEYLIDNTLSEMWVGYSTDGTALIFENDPPEQIKTATAYLTAFYIYTDVFSDVQADIAEKEYSYAFRWRKRAEDIVTTFAKWRRRNLPSVVSFPMVVTQIGVTGIGDGPIEESEDPEVILAGSGVEDVIDPQVP